MAFVSYVFTREEVKPDRHIYTITDSEFGKAEIAIGEPGSFQIEFTREYIKQGLPVGRNLALLTIWWYMRIVDFKGTIVDIVGWQDKYCGPIIENWTQYAAERDEHLAKLLTLI